MTDDAHLLRAAPRSNLRPDLPEMPPQIAALPVADNGYPIPCFVAWDNGKPEFRFADPAKIKLALYGRRCWVCGQALGEPGCAVAFVIGPMCSINHVSSEPPSHVECAEFSVRACPFLSKPHMRRRENDLPEHTDAAGFMIERNPGCCLVWVTRVYQAFRALGPAGGVGILFDICGVGSDQPESVSWWAEGRPATRAEVEASIATGLPQLRALAEAEGPDAVAELDRRVVAARTLLPTV
jgi:hypothetical protein